MFMSFAKANGIDIWYETFGTKENPAILLLMGACCQGILWPIEFCEKLVKAGFFVIRFDYRDAGLSTCFDFEKSPYTLTDMAKDAIGLLDFLNIQKFSLIGLSTGGPIAEILAVEHPKRVQSIALIATSLDFTSYRRALAGLPHEGPLSSPTKDYVIFMQKLFSQGISDHDLLKQRIEGWEVLNGYKVPLDKKHNSDLQKLFLSRLTYPEGLKNHLLANHLSEDLIRTIPHKVKTPTLILHGTEDPIFPLDHLQALAHAIPHATWRLVEGIGHIPNPLFFDIWISEIRHKFSLKSIEHRIN